MKDLSKVRPEQRVGTRAGSARGTSVKRLAAAADTQQLVSKPRGKEAAPEKRETEPRARRLAVDETGAGQRIDNFLLRQLKGVPKSHIYRILRSGEVRLNSQRVKPDARLAAGDELRIPPLRASNAATQRAPVPPATPPILYEDEALLVIDKPAGVAVHGGSGVSFGVIEQLRAARPDAKFLELVHRLDRETSGLLLLAKKRSALTSLHEQMRDGETDKRYLALATGDWKNKRQHVKLP